MPGSGAPRGTTSRSVRGNRNGAAAPEGPRVVSTSSADISASATTLSQTAVKPSQPSSTVASTGPAARPLHIDNPNQPATRPRRWGAAPARTHGSAPENSAASPAPISSREINRTVKLGAHRCPRPPSAPSTPPEATVRRA